MTPKSRIAPDLFNSRDLIIRHLIILVMSLFFGSLNTVNQGELIGSLEWFRNLGFNFVYIAAIWNGNIFLVNNIDRFVKWETHLIRFLVYVGAIAVIWPVLIHYIFNLIVFPMVHGHPCAINSRENITFLIISVTITLLVNTIFAAAGFFQFWRESIREKEELKREGMTAEFEALKSQINPHFLFNSLNTLTSLIEESPQTATRFVQQMSGVYRYLLTQKDKELVSLREELTFIKSYVYLNEIRFGENLKVIIENENEFADRKIVTLSLQMLVENAIKHNVISSGKPLYVHIKVTEKFVEVCNSLQPKQVSPESNGIGLNNIVHRYHLLGNDQVEITDDGKIFCVKLPLLN